MFNQVTGAVFEQPDKLQTQQRFYAKAKLTMECFCYVNVWSHAYDSLTQAISPVYLFNMIIQRP